MGSSTTIFSSDIKRVGLLGLGKMGAPMAGHLHAKGFEVLGYDPVKAACDDAAVRGARRERHFAEGGSMVMWKGGVATRIPNKRRIANRTACRKFSIE